MPGSAGIQPYYGGPNNEPDPNSPLASEENNYGDANFGSFQDYASTNPNDPNLAAYTATQKNLGPLGTGAGGSGTPPNVQLAREGYQPYTPTAAPGTPGSATTISTAGMQPYTEAQQALLRQLGSQAAGTGGPTVADQQLQTALAQTLAAQRAGAAGARGPSAGLQARAIQENAANTEAGMAGTAAALRAGEQQNAEQQAASLANTGAQQQAQLAGAQTAASQFGANTANQQWQFLNNMNAEQVSQENAAIAQNEGAGQATGNTYYNAFVPFSGGVASGIGQGISNVSGAASAGSDASAASDASAVAAAAHGMVVAGDEDDEQIPQDDIPAMAEGGFMASPQMQKLGDAADIAELVMAAKGGTMDMGTPAPKVLPSKPGGHIVRIGEAGPEAVVPLSEPAKSQFFAAIKAMAEKRGKHPSSIPAPAMDNKKAVAGHNAKESAHPSSIAHALALAGHGLEQRVDGLEAALSKITKKKARASK